MSEWVADAIVMLDGQNGGFHSYVNCDEARKVLNEGWNESGQIVLKETPDRPIPQSLKDGLTQIADILVKMEPNTFYCLN